MKKIIINENWEEEIIEDTSSFFVLIFKHGTNMGYVKAYSTDNEEILAAYTDLISQYEGVYFEDPANIIVIKLPTTGQVKYMLEKALYNGEENNPDQVEIINHLLTRADCEYVGETTLKTLTEAKKKKKRKKKKTPRVTYTTGWPWYNDHMFNHHMGSCECNKDKDEAGENAADNANDAIGGGESIGDAGSESSGDFGGDVSTGDAGGMGESLMKEAMTPLEKMQALENGTRGFNAAAASDQKLWDNLRICAANNLLKAYKVMQDELVKRGLLNFNQQNTTTTKQNSTTSTTTNTPVKFKKEDLNMTRTDIQPADVFYILDNKNNSEAIYSLLIDNITSANFKTKVQTLKALMIYLAIALYLKEISIVNDLKTFIMSAFEMSSAELKQLLLDAIMDNKEINSRVKDCINTALEERNK